MTYKGHHNAYKAAAWREETKTMQVILLYEGVLRYVQQAKQAMENKDIEARYNGLTKACDILTGLQLSLDFEHGGEIAPLLYDYYAGLDQRLSSLHWSNDVALCEVCIRHITMMKNAWEDVHVKLQQEQPQKSDDANVIISRLQSIRTEVDVPQELSLTAAYQADLSGINLNA